MLTRLLASDNEVVREFDTDNDAVAVYYVADYYDDDIYFTYATRIDETIAGQRVGVRIYRQAKAVYIP